MAVFRVEKTKDFTIMSNHHADVTLPLSVSELREAADGQLSMFGVGRPSVMDQLAANRPADKKSPAQTFSRKNHEPEI